jgi:hypothetical protein
MKKAFLILLVVGMFQSCEEVSKSIDYMKELNEAIDEKYDFEDVNLTMDLEALTVSLVDERFADYSVEQKKELAQDIGKMARRIKKNQPDLTDASVQFVSQKEIGPVKMKDSESYLMFPEEAKK